MLKAPLFEGLGVFVYKAIVTEGEGLTVEASDCCIQGDVYKVVMKQTKPARIRLKGKEDRVGGLACNSDEITTFPVETLESWQRGKVKIKRVVAISGVASAYMRFGSSGTLTVTAVKGIRDACGL